MSQATSPNEKSRASSDLGIRVLGSGDTPSPAVPPSDEVFVFPATSAQRRFWFLDNLQQTGNIAFNMPLPLRLRGPLDQRALRRALNEVVRRHEALRTTFVSDRGRLRQLISPELSFDLPVVRAAESELERLLREEAEKPFDLVCGPLFRGRLVKFDERDHLLIMSIHHIISDGWSNGLLVKDLGKFYATFQTGKPTELPELPFQFADFAEWQLERIAAGDFDWQRGYWRRQLEGNLPVLDLPTDRPRLRSGMRAVGMRHCIFPRELDRRAKTFAAEESASPFMLYLAIWELLLHRYTGQNDFLVTSPSANRDRQEFESVVGLFVNPLLLRADFRGDLSFRELLARVRTVALDAFANQDVPFELLLDEFQASRLPVNFLYQRAFAEKATMPDGLAIEPVHCLAAGAVYELSAAVIEDSEGVRLELEYDPVLFDAATIERMLGHYQRLLESALTNPTKSISDLPFVTTAERDQFELDHFPTTTGEAWDLRRLLAARVLTRPDAVAVRHGKRELSCAELLARLESGGFSEGTAETRSDLDQVAGWIEHWRARREEAASTVRPAPPELEHSLRATAQMFWECAGLQPGERVVSFSKPGVAATEEIGAALLADALLLYPTPEVIAAGPAAILGWLEREKVAIAFMPALLWNWFSFSLDRKLLKPSGLRLVIATEGAPDEGTFGRIADGARCRKVVDAVGTIEFEGKIFPAAAHLHVIDLHSGEPLPIGVVGRLMTAGGVDTMQQARWRSDRRLELLPATKDRVRSYGLCFDLRHLENVIASISEVRHALVRPTSQNGKSGLLAYLLPRSAGAVLPKDISLRQLLREKGLPDELLPTGFVRLKNFPLRGAESGLVLPELPATRAVTASDPVRPYIGLQLQLIAIWEDVLGVREIGIRDNFFELGGNSLLVIRMLQRAEAACGKQILPSALFRNATIEHLASEIAQEVIRDSPALLRVNDSGHKTPFFYLHGDLFGGGFYSLKLSRALGPDQPFYVLPPYDVRSSTVAPSIEQMAAAHLTALRAVRPQGPYVIGGFCVGGLVAYELVQQIRAAGEEVEMLLLIDASPDDKMLRRLRSLGEKVGAGLGWKHETQLSHFGTWVNWWMRLVFWSNRHFEGQMRTVRRRVGQLLRRLLGLRSRTTTSIDLEQPLTLPDAKRDIPSTFLWASAGYGPTAYDSPVALLLSEDIALDSALVGQWSQLAPALTVQRLPGRHLECITTHVDLLAETIKTCLKDVRRKE